MLKLQNTRIVLPTLMIFAVLVNVAAAGTLETIFDGGSRNFGAAFDVTNLSGSPITLTGEFESGFNGNYPGGPAPFPEVEVWLYNGTLSVSALSSGSGWSLLSTVSGLDPSGQEARTAFDIGTTLPLAAGETKGIFLYARGDTNAQPKPIVYSETGVGPNHTSYDDGTLRITNFYGMGFSSVADGSAYPAADNADIFASGRTWNGSITYVPEPATLGMLVIVAPLMLRRIRRRS